MPALKLALSNDARKFLEALDAKRLRQIFHKIIDLTLNPEPPDSAALRGYEGRRVDAGEFRIIYQVVDDTLHIPLVGKRNDDEVYKDLKRL